MLSFTLSSFKQVYLHQKEFSNYHDKTARIIEMFVVLPLTFRKNKEYTNFSFRFKNELMHNK